MADIDAPSGKDGPHALKSGVRWRRAHRFAAGLTHLAFVLVILLAAVRADFSQRGDGEGQAIAGKLSEAQLQEAPEQETVQSLGAGEDAAENATVPAPNSGRIDEKPAARAEITVEASPPAAPSNAPEDSRIARLLAAYPDFLAGYENNQLIWRDGSRMAFDDGRVKDFQQRLVAPDIEDMFAQPYPQGPLGEAPGVNADPGRVRHDRFFTRIYGDCRKGEVEAKLVDVIWLPKHINRKIKATSINGVAERLQRVSNELDALPERFMEYLQPIAGTFNCRNIARSDRLSAHSYGIAIDLNAKYGDYWQWHKPNRDGTYEHRNSIPWEIAQIFEKHGFIWGAKWYHFDSFHFEFRPELLPDFVHGLPGE